MWQFAGLLTLLACGIGLLACQFNAAQADTQQRNAEAGAADPQGEQGLIIENVSPLPDTYPRAPYLVRLAARGGVPPLHWRVEKGALPPGIKLEDDGQLHGEVEREGEFQFTASVTDSGKPQLAVRKDFVIPVRAAFILNWKSQAHVSGNRIEGSAEVSNTTADDMDLTFIVLAVAGNGRATTIGYQHFLLRRGTIAKELPFGDTLPHGGYVVHVDAVAEVEPKRLIYRKRMQTSGPLQVTIGP